MDKENVKRLIDRVKNDRKALVILLIGIVGIILFVISSAAETEPVAEPETDTDFDEAAYTQQLESKLEGMVSMVNGAGRTEVAVTLECDYETVYARDIGISQRTGTTDEKSEYIIIDSEKSEEGLLLKTVTPRVRGVAVVCEGGDLQYVRSAVVEMMSALLDVGANHISVAKIK